MTRKSAHEIKLVKPAIETLLSRDQDSLWPKEILRSRTIVSQTQLRERCLESLEEIFRAVRDPTTEISTALQTKLLDPGVVSEFFKVFAAFLDADPAHRRLVLYFPFELIPEAALMPSSEPVILSQEKFRGSYIKRWRELLEETEVRANFVDGNILEPELAPNGQEIVRKAAHFIPQLIQKRFVSTPEMLALEDSTSSDVLRRSIREAFFSESADDPPIGKTPDRAWLMSFKDEAASELKKLDMRSALDYSRGMPPARVAWERQNNENDLVSLYAECIAYMVYRKTASWDDVQPLFVNDSSSFVRLTAMRGLGLAIERAARKDLSGATEVARLFIEQMRTSAPHSAAIRDELESILSHLAYLEAATEDQLRSFGFELPKLDGEFNETGELARDIGKFTGSIRTLAQNSEYSRLIYPAAIFFGSRLKGYAKANADLDAAVFIRPGTPMNERARIREIVSALFKDQNIGGKVVEFWLKGQGKELCVRDFDNPDVLLADSSWIHLLFAGVWLGEKKTLQEIYAKLLPGFFYSKGKTVMERDARTLWLGEIEREVLQYRLMHKGYRRFFPPMGGINPAAKKLDPQSAFWDSGYRRLATKLFLTRVFLPQL